MTAISVRRTRLSSLSEARSPKRRATTMEHSTSDAADMIRTGSLKITASNQLDSGSSNRIATIAELSMTINAGDRTRRTQGFRPGFADQGQEVLLGSLESHG